MKKLNRNRPFGTITPPYNADDIDRAAHYEQGGALFDHHDREIIPGQPLPPEEAAPVAPVVVPAVNSAALELLQKSDSLSAVELRKQAKVVLGDDAPKKIADIIKALEEAVDEADEPEAAEAEKATGLTWGGMTGKGDGVDLAAWARGKADYLWGEVQQAIRKEHNKQISERRDAVDFLIDMEVIKGAEARTDF